jgi:hypothetical protein
VPAAPRVGRGFGRPAGAAFAPGGGGGSAWFVEDFSTYANIAALVGTPPAGAGTYTGPSAPWSSVYRDAGGSFALNADGVNIDGLSLTQSLRVNFPDMTALTGTRCDNYTMRPVLNPPGMSTQRRLWWECYLRFSSNWDTRPGSGWGCGNAPDHKTLLIAPAGGSGRWEVKIGFGTGGLGPAIMVGDPANGTGTSGESQFPNLLTWLNNDPEAVGPTYWNNQWHRLRVAVDLGTTPGASDGRFRVWMNDALLHSRTGLTYSAGITGFTDMQMGANRNVGASANMSFDWGLIRIYNTDPSW